MDLILSDVCQEIRNWFVRRDSDKHPGRYEIRDGAIVAPFLIPGQYFRVVGSTFNDGVHQYPATDMTDETFDGSVWAMAVPQSFLALAESIAAWRAKYEAADSPAMSPFSSENFFGDYSYSKSAAGGGSNSSGGGGTSWKTAYGPQLNKWRKIL